MVGNDDPHLAVAIFVRNHRQPQESLEGACSRFGVDGIVREKLSFEGGIFREGNKLIIKLNVLSPAERQRFTLAHELAHLMLAPGSSVSARRCSHSDNLEVACDLIAAELLIPLDEIRYAVVGNESVEALISLAHRFQVSLQAMAVRLCSLKLWKHSIGFWQWNGGATELWFAGRRLWLNPKPHFVAFEMAMASQETVKMSEFYYRGASVHSARIEVRRLGQRYLLAVVA